MIRIDIPSRDQLELEHLVLDYNGTLAVGGALLPGVAERIYALAERIEVHVVTADTYGTARAALAGLPLKVQLLPAGGEREAKAALVHRLGAEGVVAVGNGANDAAMLAAAAVGIAVIQAEGCASAALGCADLVCTSILDALGLFLEPRALKATLRH